ncbi:MAG: hypothetical protein V7608_5216 [Hyphomicrobiales bacterium]|jgi:hypothetical protein
MLLKRSAMRFLAGAALVLLVAPASAQQTLVCFTLHNDLANFDRRAHRPQFPAERDAAQRAAADYAASCPGGEAGFASSDCAALGARADRTSAAYFTMLRTWGLSPIGGSDPVRLRIIKEMYQNRCPMPDDVELLRPPPRRRR